MSTMGVAVYCNRVDNSDRDQCMLLRTLQDNERNIISNRSQVIAPKNNVSVINVVSQPQHQLQQRSENEQNQQRRMVHQAALPPYDPSRLKKHGKNGQPPPVAVARRNARERNRVKQVNNGFATLRQHIPSHVAAGYGDRGKKLSKVETLRMAVEYIRGLQRLLAEADGLEYDAGLGRALDAIPSPTGSLYSTSTHNGSGEVLGLASELDDRSAAGEPVNLDEDDRGSFILDEDDENDERDSQDKQFARECGRTSQRLSENLNRDRTLPPSAKRRKESPHIYYGTRQPMFGDEENIEPNDSVSNRNLVSAHFSPVTLQAPSPPLCKKEARIVLEVDEDVYDRSEEEGRLRSSPYSEALDSQDTTRLLPVKIEDATSAQLVYLTSSDLPIGPIYYKHEVPESGEFMDMVSWWEQEQGRIIHMGQQHTQRMAHV